MSNKQNMGRDPEKRAAKRRAQRAAIERGAQINARQPSGISQSQATHASNPKARKQAAEGKRKMERNP